MLPVRPLREFRRPPKSDVEIGSGFWTQHLTFRDHLRANPDVAERYAALKRELAARFSDDREAYAAAKSDFIAACLPGARVQDL